MNEALPLIVVLLAFGVGCAVGFWGCAVVASRTIHRLQMERHGLPLAPVGEAQMFVQMRDGSLRTSDWLEDHVLGYLSVPFEDATLADMMDAYDEWKETSSKH